MARVSKITSMAALASLVCSGFLAWEAKARTAARDQVIITDIGLLSSIEIVPKSKACRHKSVQQAQFGGWCCDHGWCWSGWRFYHCCKRWC